MRAGLLPNQNSWLQVAKTSHLLAAQVAITLLCQACDSHLLFVSLPPQIVLCSTPFGFGTLHLPVGALCAKGNFGEGGEIHKGQ